MGVVLDGGDGAEGLGWAWHASLVRLLGAGDILVAAEDDLVRDKATATRGDLSVPGLRLQAKVERG
jgi:hypothetical protein